MNAPEDYAVGIVLEENLGDTQEKREENLKGMNLTMDDTIRVRCSSCQKYGLASDAMIMSLMKTKPKHKISYLCVNCMRKSADDESPFLQVPTVTGQTIELASGLPPEGRERLIKSVALSMMSQGLTVTDDVPQDSPFLKEILDYLFEVVEDFKNDQSVPQEEKYESLRVFLVMRKLYDAGLYNKAIDLYTAILVRTLAERHQQSGHGECTCGD